MSKTDKCINRKINHSNKKISKYSVLIMKLDSHQQLKIFCTFPVELLEPHVLSECLLHPDRILKSKLVQK